MIRCETDLNSKVEHHSRRSYLFLRATVFHGHRMLGNKKTNSVNCGIYCHEVLQQYNLTQGDASPLQLLTVNSFPRLL